VSTRGIGVNPTLLHTTGMPVKFKQYYVPDLYQDH